jgi:hypothetical protein
MLWQRGKPHNALRPGVIQVMNHDHCAGLLFRFARPASRATQIRRLLQRWPLTEGGCQGCREACVTPRKKRVISPPLIQCSADKLRKRKPNGPNLSPRWMAKNVCEKGEFVKTNRSRKRPPAGPQHRWTEKLPNFGTAAERHVLA